MSYVANTEAQRKEMLAACGLSSMEELFAAIPEELRPKSFDLLAGKSELEVRSYLSGLARRNYSHLVYFLGGGIYDHYIPAAVDALACRGEFTTSYTPYQPECSQGTLQAIYEYQTQICRLTGMEASNASLYDGGSALCEACHMALAATGRSRIVMDSGINPVYRQMIRTYTANLSIELAEAPLVLGQSSRDNLFSLLNGETAAVILQNPNFFGVVDDHSDIVAHCHEMGVLAVQSVYPIALALVKTPGEIGADIATGEGQSLGLPLGFGGPYLGFMATTRGLVRKMPGRVAGRTVDRNGRESFVLTLQAREQHIRREKATSNICTNQALCALRAHMYLSLVGREGIKEIANLCLAKTAYAMERFRAIPGVEVADCGPAFNEFVVRLSVDAAGLIGRLIDHGIAPGLPLGRFYPGMNEYLLVAVTEKRTKFEIGRLAETVEAVLCQ
ncbi:MAG: aminomethyl-transferring glycine dehydrogenase subunit GcvPA [Acidobacteria bacterium]|nr:aminomethyl-transferring glycine dehydrogenase subunit GcvPA [Acidobacteriota bacterium]